MGPGGVPVSAFFDWRQEGPQTWDIEIETNKGPLALREGGAEGEADEEEAARRLARCGERDHLGEPLRHAPLPHGVAALAGASIPERVVVVEHPRMHLP